MVGENATRYRAIAARCNYLSLDRPDLQFAVKEVCREMSKPTSKSWARLRRIGQYLNGTPCVVWQFDWQDQCSTLDVFADANWAGCRRTRKSTSGGCVMVGYQCIKSWSKTQAVVAKSSAESELYGIVKATCEALGTLTLIEELGGSMQAMVHVDASAARCVVERAGLDKVRHIDVNVSWLKEQEILGRAPLREIYGIESPGGIDDQTVGRQKGWAISYHMECYIHVWEIREGLKPVCV